MSFLIRLILFMAVIVFAVRLLRRLTLAETPLEVPGNSTGIGPHEVLGVSRKASPDDIERAYKQAMSQYHPDKVSHLGVELQELAQRKTREIMQAYQALRS